MYIDEIIETISSFKRYLTYINEHGNDEIIIGIRDNQCSLIFTLKSHNRKTYDLEVWNLLGELHIVNVVNHSSVFDFADEYGWTEETVNYLKYGTNKTNSHFTEGKMLHKEESLIDYLYNRLSENGYTDISITNIRTFADGNLIADVAYTWRLNAWEHRAEHKDSIFVYADNKWYSPIFI